MVFDLKTPNPKRGTAAPAEGRPAGIGGYYQPDDAKASAALRPSKTFNDILAQL